MKEEKIMKRLQVLRSTVISDLKLIAILLIFVFSIIAQEKVKKATKPNASEKSNQKSKTAKLPTAEEILERYVQALGGREAHLKIKTRILKGDIEFLPLGIKGKIESYSLEPNKSYSKTILQGIGEITEVCDGVRAWSIDPIMGNRKKEGEELEQAKIEALIHKDIKLDSIYSSFEVKGVEKIGSNYAYVVVATRQKFPSNVFYFDTKTGLLLAQEGILVTPQGKITSKSIPNDWREVEGVKIPFQTTLITPQFQVVIKLNSVELNKAVDPKLFEAPEWILN
jgi:cell division protein FtsB